MSTRSDSSSTLTRREMLALTAAALLPDMQSLKRTKKVIVAGAGIGGLSCAWELVRRGHDVTVLEASARTGGHVFTVREGLDDGLYADGGAEHFTQPGYERYWGYVREFDLPHVYVPRREHLLRWINGTMYTPEMLADRQVLSKLGLNPREVDYLTTHPFPELASLYFAPYVDRFADEYRPFDAGLDALDQHHGDGALSQGRRVRGGADLHRRQRFRAAGRLARGDSETSRRAACFRRRCTVSSAATRRCPTPSRNGSGRAYGSTVRSPGSSMERRVFACPARTPGR